MKSQANSSNSTLYYNLIQFRMLMTNGYVSERKRPPVQLNIVHENFREALAVTRFISGWESSMISILFVMSHTTGLWLRLHTDLQMNALGPLGHTNLYKIVISYVLGLYTLSGTHDVATQNWEFLKLNTFYIIPHKFEVPILRFL